MSAVVLVCFREPALRDTNVWTRLPSPAAASRALRTCGPSCEQRHMIAKADDWGQVHVQTVLSPPPKSLREDVDDLYPVFDEKTGRKIPRSTFNPELLPTLTPDELDELVDKPANNTRGTAAKTTPVLQPSPPLPDVRPVGGVVGTPPCSNPTQAEPPACRTPTTRDLYPPPGGNPLPVRPKTQTMEASCCPIEPAPPASTPTSAPLPRATPSPMHWKQRWT